MPELFSVTYEIVTPESAEEGDAAERGFVLPGEWRQSANEIGDVRMSLRDAMRLAYPQEDCGNWWAEADGRTDYETGAVETRCIHPPRNITAASYARVSRLLGLPSRR
ncbi:hypothetical protein NON00_02240 [Roseomonas sp. GC11]|uniref:hypothetical protein n=1 Tax=Roseomonas sp. GC11 TaxID=2950546 RepID=UPI002108B99D|nr:hypothetical protein [Roseomonas sp. GC11]MCQ4158746.1 hypothetical protein [Roseomonas sp. GC11]